MATETGGPATAGPAAEETKAQEQSQQKPAKESKGKQPAVAAETGDNGEKKLSNAELKKKAKEEKAARRAQAKVASTGPGPAGGSAAADGKGGKPKQKQDAPQGQAPQQGRPPLRPVAVVSATSAEVKPTIPECFSHLSVARRIDMMHADKDVHPAVLALGQHMSTFAISDSITRLEATLLAFKKVIDSYTPPHGTSFSRHFTSHVLNPQIEYLQACRPMCFSMGNAVRWLKLQISKIDIDLPDMDAKKLLIESIDNFISERISLADYVIVKTAADMIEDGEVILTYAHHYLVEKTFMRAKEQGKNFEVILIDDPYDRAGLTLAKTLAAAGITVSYSPDLGALRSNIRESTAVFVASEAMFSNGAMYARAGTCDIAAAAADLSVRVVALCETINFTERVSIDSLTYNEIDPERNAGEGFRLLFDTTRDKFVSVVVTELGNTAPTSVPAILRKLEEL